MKTCHLSCSGFGEKISLLKAATFLRQQKPATCSQQNSYPMLSSQSLWEPRNGTLHTETSCNWYFFREKEELRGPITWAGLVCPSEVGHGPQLPARAAQQKTLHKLSLHFFSQEPSTWQNENGFGFLPLLLQSKPCWFQAFRLRLRRLTAALEIFFFQLYWKHVLLKIVSFISYSGWLLSIQDDTLSS